MLALLVIGIIFNAFLICAVMVFVGWLLTGAEEELHERVRRIRCRYRHPVDGNRLHPA